MCCCIQSNSWGAHATWKEDKVLCIVFSRPWLVICAEGQSLPRSKAPAGGTSGSRHQLLATSFAWIGCSRSWRQFSICCLLVFEADEDLQMKNLRLRSLCQPQEIFCGLLSTVLDELWSTIIGYSSFATCRCAAGALLPTPPIDNSHVRGSKGLVMMGAQQQCSFLKDLTDLFSGSYIKEWALMPSKHEQRQTKGIEPDAKAACCKYGNASEENYYFLRRVTVWTSWGPNFMKTCQRVLLMHDVNMWGERCMAGHLFICIPVCPWKAHSWKIWMVRQGQYIGATILSWTWQEVQSSIFLCSKAGVCAHFSRLNWPLITESSFLTHPLSNIVGTWTYKLIALAML